MAQKNKPATLNAADRQVLFIITGLLLLLMAFCSYQCSRPAPPPTAADVDFKQGYDEGLGIGASAGKLGLAVPSASSLRNSAERSADVHGKLGDRDYIRGFTAGFEQGYKAVTKKAF